ncbi:hypothetical protein Goshw_023160 [Gossypium schwendimanii]|uniref:Leucine-rich repeat-containing N-terminal plant-type domain-containing protein n=1 Tax=Gossypium schwendimanii TaxID=34291 RepID=A0A7J9MPP2_GOSSC|nr:hypothetical protein [Gossypium schwendimanii]
MLLTGHVTELQLGSSNDTIVSRIKKVERIKLAGKLSLALLDLKHLPYLELSNNDFDPTQIPNCCNNFTGSLPGISLNVTALNLSSNVLSGHMSQFLCHKKHQMRLKVLNLEGNLLSGEMEKFGGH